MAKSKSWTLEDIHKKGFVADEDGNYAKNNVGKGMDIKINIPIPLCEDIKLKKSNRPKATIIKKSPSVASIHDCGCVMLIKPLSINQAWQGKRFKTAEYIRYEETLINSLPDIQLPEAPYEIYFKFGFSSSASDWDNCVKTTQDVLSKRY